VTVVSLFMFFRFVYIMSSLNLIGVCRNNAFRKIFTYNRWESVKLLQFHSGCLDFVHSYVSCMLHIVGHAVDKISLLKNFVLVLNCTIIQSRDFVIIMVL
jgi:hypothetical protein